MGSCDQDVGPATSRQPGEAAGTLAHPLLDPASDALPALSHAIVAQVGAAVPEYSDDPSGVIGAESRRAVRDALRMFLRTRVAGLNATDEQRETFRRLGRLEARAGRSLDTLQTAYRMASLAVLRQLMDGERGSDAPRESTAQLAAALFEFIDELAALSTEGFAAVGAGRADDPQHRVRLVRLLLGADRGTARVVVDTAARAGWVLPELATVVELVGDPAAPERDLVAAAARRFGPDALCVPSAGRVIVVVPGAVDVGELRRARPRDDGGVLYVGVGVPLADLPSAARLVRRVRALPAARDAVREGVVACEDHLLALVGDRAGDALRAMAAVRLAPLLGQPLAKRVKYGRLLSAWLEYGSIHGSAPGVLDKHRQTLRYQITRLERLLGDALQDRDARLELMLALRSVLPAWERELAADQGSAAVSS